MKNGPYILVVAPDGFPGKKYRGRYCYEHHLVWWQAHGIVPNEKEVIHHKDGNKHNNALENLELTDFAGHAAHHRQPRTMIKFHCPWCGKDFWRCRRAALPKFRKHTYCCRSCAGHAAQKDKSFLEGDYEFYIIETKKAIVP